MSRRSRNAARKRKKFKRMFISIFAIAVIGGIVFFFASDCFEETKTNFLENSYPQKYSEYVEKAAEDYNLEQSLIYAVIRTESNFNPDAESSAGACGIMQIMPSSFEWLQTKRGEEGQYTEEDLFDPEICIDYGAYFLKYLYDYYGDERSAVAAYNAGFVVSDWLEDSRYSSDGETLIEIPYSETSDYVDKVESAKEMYIKLYYS
ncbi:MAG: lytic transglycosylase domain-containing protein [Clostridiales bacterium]|nr:lytic transglycosylase domain-containing protein [Clostridiales bacterium]